MYLRWIVLAWTLVATAALACRPEPQLPSMGAAPSFSLTDQAGRPFSASDVNGRVVLANFIYTSCTDVCPLLSQNMGLVQEQLKADGSFGSKALLLSFSVDPERDTPPVLAAYGERFSVDAAGWKMLTGPIDQIGRLADEFKLGRAIPLPLDTQHPQVNLAHTNRFVLVDGSGQMRAFYSGDTLEVQDVVRDMRRLAR
jgi:protein SCO1/2